MIAAMAVPLQNGRSLSAVTASMMMKDVEAVSKASVMRLAKPIKDREEEVRRPIGGIVTTDDQKVDGEFQKLVLRDKEVDLVVAGAAR